MDMATARVFLDGLVDPARVRTLRYSPIIKAGKYMHVRVPESLRQGEPITLVEVESAAEVGAILKKATDEETPVYVRQGDGLGGTIDIIEAGAAGVAGARPAASELDTTESLDGGYVEIGPAVHGAAR